MLPKHSSILPNPEAAAETTEVPALTEEAAIQAMRTYFDGTIVSNFQYAYVGKDVSGGGGGTFDPGTRTWTFEVISRPYFRNDKERKIGTLTVAADGSVSSSPSKEDICRVVDSDQQTAYQQQLMTALMANL